MSLVKTFLYKIGHLLLSIVRILRKAICCRRKKEAEYLLPLTVGHVIDMELIKQNEYEHPEFKSQWETWPDSGNNQTSLNNGGIRTDSQADSELGQPEEGGEEDFFKDMVPQIRKPKKVFIKNDLKESELDFASSNRLAMDPRAVLMEPDLGIIDDGPSNWEDNENLDELWDPDQLIREKKRAEHEKRRAEHQRRKLEKESRRTCRPESLSNMMLNLSDSKDKHKYS
ncbi:receptor-binding cancer antigen expressed on SiSo cells-like [Argiope bruennichi]|uniref:Receptor-binding cancer antigen expressed on like protein n=1 Tax=Argiope bruennichi TaxID=94029 RepID=A0A8T0FQ12_ARGBR|nr:receptor-binding cancer antigen expressed on SiSo cells-like [Argiope bruennichi]KAF8790823.1 Receptor-binding cancer antigen expressed on like protein [Argiope bruennichi]